MLHYMVIVVAEDIPKYTELTYDYGSDYVLEGDVSACCNPRLHQAAAGLGCLKVSGSRLL